MYQRLLEYFAHNKYRLFMFVGLAGATIISVAVWRVRTEISRTANYAFLIWFSFAGGYRYDRVFGGEFLDQGRDDFKTEAREVSPNNSFGILLVS